MNAMILGTEEGRILLDCGVTFAGMDPDLGVRPLGVSIIHPDFGALLAPRPGEPADVLRAIVITHGHEDHIGALPYLLRDLEMPLPPIYGPIYALELVKQRLGEMQVEAPAMHAIEVGKVFEAGPFTIEPYHVNHSIVDAMGLIFRTPAGTIVHSGDFKIEDVPADAPFPEDRLKALGDEGVALLMSDSTNVFAEGRSGDEATAAAALDALIAEQEQRVVIALFASNVHRMRSAFASARKHGRRVLLAGRSVHKHFELARELGHLKGVSDLLVRPENARKVPRHQLLVLATGTQGEPPAALAKFARGEHRDLDLEPGDTVIMSSRVIPAWSARSSPSGRTWRASASRCTTGPPTPASTSVATPTARSSGCSSSGCAPRASFRCTAPGGCSRRTPSWPGRPASRPLSRSRTGPSSSSGRARSGSWARWRPTGSSSPTAGSP